MSAYGMNMVKVDRQQLLAKVSANKETHRAEFEKAQEGFKKRVIAEFERRLADARNGVKYDVHFNFPEPRDHTSDYERIIAMLEMSVEGTIQISQDEFAMYVMDDWAWKGQFTTTNAMYVGSPG